MVGVHRYHVVVHLSETERLLLVVPFPEKEHVFKFKQEIRRRAIQHGVWSRCTDMVLYIEYMSKEYLMDDMDSLDSALSYSFTDIVARPRIPRAIHDDEPKVTDDRVCMDAMVSRFASLSVAGLFLLNLLLTLLGTAVEGVFELYVGPAGGTVETVPVVKILAEEAGFKIWVIYRVSPSTLRISPYEYPHTCRLAWCHRVFYCCMKLKRRYLPFALRD
ncbi:uncharacterized protein K452DRAFT_332745 [Aplosporella prunicola CBS 121167]|uniref:Uncharacterized protein n=1 Tax=Aplosporella prunicola CBS 121167 TaxID=1176127 RepID=A0A6A6BCY9_9PEZI|nr:uncharacterized protein K452DRAFT_332745 [Aplosporella prunicola CBS 121167]KAF2142010.1 hypothetical protein K452DRAFT_332745 [Aplosporella prunicola CBS 121167]